VTWLHRAFKLQHFTGLCKLSTTKLRSKEGLPLHLHRKRYEHHAEE